MNNIFEISGKNLPVIREKKTFSDITRFMKTDTNNFSNDLTRLKKKFGIISNKSLANSKTKKLDLKINYDD